MFFVCGEQIISYSCYAWAGGTVQLLMICISFSCVSYVEYLLFLAVDRSRSMAKLDLVF